MDVNTRNRTELKSYFVKNSIPSEGNFAELIEGTLNQKDDGLVKLPDNPLSIEAGDKAGQKRVINFYRDFADPNPDWSLNLNPRSDPNDPGTAQLGFNISDGEGNSRLFIDRNTGNVGLGATSPGAALEVAGNIVASNVSLARTNTNRGTLFLATAGDFNHALYNNYSNIDDEGQWNGAKWNVFAGLDIRIGSGASKRSSLYINDSGNVGIGTTNPGAALEVAGNIVASNVSLARTNTNRGTLFLATAGDFNHALYNNYSNIDDEGQWDGAKWNVFAGLDIRIGSGASKRSSLYINDSGNVGIGTTSAPHTLSMPATGTFYSHGRMHIHGEELLYLLNKSGVIIGNEWGGNGNLTVRGTFSCPNKRFEISHPTRAGLTLAHACMEGPELAVFYRSEAQLVNGQIAVELPAYFEALTRKEGRTVQLTPKGSEPYLLSYTDIIDGTFNVYGTKSDGVFSWEVKAIRADVEPLEVEVEADPVQ